MDDPKDKARIAANVQKMLAQGAKQEDVESYLQAEGLSPVNQQQPQVHKPLNPTQIRRLGESQAEKNAAESAPWYDIGEQIRGALPEGATKKFLGAAALPLQGLPGGEAAEAAIGSSRLGGNTDYRTALRTQRETTNRIGEGGQMALKAIGGIAGMAIPGASAVMSNPLGQAAVGAAYGASDADPDQSSGERMLRGGIGAVAAPALGWAGGKLLGTNTAAKLGGRAAEMIQDTPELMKLAGALTPQAASLTGKQIATPTASQALQDALAAVKSWGTLTDAQRAAVRRLANASARDVRAGLSGQQEFPNHAGMPETLGADVASPSVLEEARGATKSVAGRAGIEPVLEARSGKAVSSVTEGMPDAMAQRYALAQARKANAKQQMEAAIEASTGQAIDLTPELEQIAKTPAGKSGLKSAVRSRLNVPERELPDVPVKPAAQVEGYEPTEFVPPGEQPTQKGVDAETLHLWTRALRRMAQGEANQQKPAGKAASDAIASGELRAKVVEALPDDFKQAMNDYRSASEEIGALDLGRTKHPENPIGLNKADKSLTDVERQVAGMSDKNREAYQIGKQFDLASRLRGGQSVESMAEAAAIPGSPTAREAALSGAPIAPRLAAWNRALQTHKSLISGEGPTRIRTGEGPSMDVVAPTERWAGVRALREMYGKMSDRARERQGLSDAAFTQILAKSAPEYQQALAAAETPGDREKIIRAAIAALTAQSQGGTELPYAVQNLIPPQ